MTYFNTVSVNSNTLYSKEPQRDDSRSKVGQFWFQEMAQSVPAALVSTIRVNLLWVFFKKALIWYFSEWFQCQRSCQRQAGGGYSLMLCLETVWPHWEADDRLVGPLRDRNRKIKTHGQYSCFDLQRSEGVQQKYQNTFLNFQTWHGKLYDKSNVCWTGLRPLGCSFLQRFGKISQRMGDFALCKATLENNLIGAMQQCTGLSSSVTQNPVRRGKMKCKLPLGESSISIKSVFMLSGP